MPAMFSFNNPVGACESCKGFGRTMDIDPDLVVPDPRVSIGGGCIKTFQSASYEECQADLMKFCRRAGIPTDVPWAELPESTRRIIWDGEPGGRKSWRTKWYGLHGFFRWLEGRTYKMHVRVLLSRYRRYQPCAACGGARLKPEALAFRLGGYNLPELEALPIAEAAALFARLRGQQRGMPASDAATEQLLGEIRGRLKFLVDVGLGYLTLARQSRTLSGGEAQRVSLATALGSSLTSTLYVLDEPSVGLHARDAGRLSGVLARLAQAGNAVVVVEHDPALIASAGHVIDLGPGPGRQGGQVVYQGPVAGLMKEKRSVTGAFLAGSLPTNPRPTRRPASARRLIVRGARENNLKDVSVEVPLGLLVAVTGVSGSGKSTLVDQILYRNLRRQFGQGESEPGACQELVGADQLDGVVLVDQSPLGASSRVNAATYLGVLDPLRAAFAACPEAKERGLTASSFSFNSEAGACPTCAGAGYEKIELQFLPDAFVRCPACDGSRYRPEVLEVKLHGHDIAALAGPAGGRGQQAVRVRGARGRHPGSQGGAGPAAADRDRPGLPDAVATGAHAVRGRVAAAEAGRAPGRGGRQDQPAVHPRRADHRPARRGCVGDAGGAAPAGGCRTFGGGGRAQPGGGPRRRLDLDLGPEGGDEGGLLVGQGTPEIVATLPTPTGQALRAAFAGERATSLGRAPSCRIAGARDRRSLRRFGTRSAITRVRILGAREHNLRDVSIEIPRNKLVAVTGVSGSGKSTLAFDVLYAEGQRRFLDCLPTYVRQFVRPLARPDVDRVEAVPPTVALEQKLSHASSMSTVGTASEVYHYLRLLFAFHGVSHCAALRAAGRDRRHRRGRGRTHAGGPHRRPDRPSTSRARR